jgi:hypothetical protein
MMIYLYWFGVILRRARLLLREPKQQQRANVCRVVNPSTWTPLVECRVADTYTKQAITPNPEPTILKDAIEGSSDCVQRWVKVQTLAHRQRALYSLKLQHNGTAFLDLRVNALVAPTIVSEIDRLQEHS